MGSYLLLLLQLLRLVLLAESRSLTLDEKLMGAAQAAAGDVAQFTKVEEDVLRVDYDILMSKEDYLHMIAGGKSKRKALRDPGRHWPNAEVPYTINPDGFSAADLNEIEESMKYWEEHTCITFRAPRSSDVTQVNIQNGNDCSSHSGLNSRGGQPLYLGPGCREKSIILHELAHAFGFIHEHQRPDRDGSITVIRENIDPKYQYALDKMSYEEVDNQDTPYDYASVMHYGAYAYTVGDGEKTVITKDSTWQYRIGTAELPSFYDIKVANLMYQCSAQCPQRSCRDDGYLDKNCVCQCKGWPTHPCDDGQADGPGYYGMECIDKHPSCAGWASYGECENNPAYMMANCGVSCGVC